MSRSSTASTSTPRTPLRSSPRTTSRTRYCASNIASTISQVSVHDTYPPLLVLWGRTTPSRMHQQARPTPRVSSPASSPQTNPSRTNNPREAILGARARASSETSGRESAVASYSTAETPPGAGPPADAVKKLDQIIQVCRAWEDSSLCKKANLG